MAINKKVKAAAITESDPKTKKSSVKRILLKRGTLDNKNHDKDDDENHIHFEEQFILRMPEGESNDRLRKAVEERNVPEEFKIVFNDSRHASVHWEDNDYYATLVDLPCIIESQKTLDRKQFFKIADISQMLIATKENDSTIDYTYPHGLSAPLKYVRKRRFRKRMSKRIIEDVEREVERLLQDDANAEDVTYDFGLNMPDKIQESSDIGTPGPTSENEEEADVDADADVDVDADVDADGDADGDMDLDNLDEESLAADIEQQLEDQNFDNEEEEEESGDEESGDEESGDDGEDGDEGDDGDEGADGDEEEEEDQEESLQQKRELIQEEIAELEAKIEEKNEQIKSVVGNQIMKKRFVDQLHSLEHELEEKQNEISQIE